MTTAARVASGLVGGLGAALLLSQVVIGVAFASICGPVTPQERCLLVLERLFGQLNSAAAWSVIYTVLNGLLFLCVKAKANPPRFWANTLRHLLMSSVLAAGLIILLLALFLVRFE